MRAASSHKIRLLLSAGFRFPSLPGWFTVFK
jgi:hypothetical protein